MATPSNAPAHDVNRQSATCHTDNTAKLNECRHHVRDETESEQLPLSSEAFDSTSSPTDLTPLHVPSKSALKKAQKRERTLQGRKLKKLAAKSERHAKAVAEGRDLQRERQDVAERTASGEGWQRRQEIWERERLPLALHHSFQVCIDCAYEEHMTVKEIASLASQIRCCYAYNKRSPHPCLLTVTSLSGMTLDLLQKETGYAEWPHRAFTGTSLSLLEHFGDRLDKVVYLTSDAEHTITELDDDAIYVIGGIVDRNRLPRAAWTRATQMNVCTAKLPLAEYLQMPTTPVLTCNHVFDILLRHRLLNHDWCETLRAVLPARKEAEFKGEKKSQDSTCIADEAACDDGPFEKSENLVLRPELSDG